MRAEAHLCEGPPTSTTVLPSPSTHAPAAHSRNDRARRQPCLLRTLGLRPERALDLFQLGRRELTMVQGRPVLLELGDAADADNG